MKRVWFAHVPVDEGESILLEDDERVIEVTHDAKFGIYHAIVLKEEDEAPSEVQS